MDRRAFSRVDLDLWIEQEHGEETVFRLAGNLSAGGIYLEHGFTHPVGTRVKLRFSLDPNDAPVEVAAEVVAAPQSDDTPTAASLAFVHLEGSVRERILRFLNERAD